MKAINITGERYGRLTAIRQEGSSGGQRMWICICDCGKETKVRQSDLRRGKTKSCGCFKNELIAAAKLKHGGNRRTKVERLYGVWSGIKTRVDNANRECYKNYGGRGIKLCEEWRDYSKFKEWAMNNGYQPDAKRGKCTIDRIDVDGDYNPQNCRFVDRATQNRNRRKNKHG